MVDRYFFASVRCDPDDFDSIGHAYNRSRNEAVNKALNKQKRCLPVRIVAAQTPIGTWIVIVGAAVGHGGSPGSGESALISQPPEPATMADDLADLTATSINAFIEINFRQ